MQTLLSHHESAEPTLSLPGLVTIENIETLASEIHTLSLPSGVSLTLDASGTEILTTPGIQLLLALEKTLARAGGKLSLIHVQESVSHAFRVFGLEAQFMQWTQRGEANRTEVENG